MPDHRSGLAMILAVAALVATAMGVRAWADRAPADVGRAAVTAALPQARAPMGTTPRPAPRPAAGQHAARAAPRVERLPAAPHPPAPRVLPLVVNVPRLGVTASIDPVGVEPDGGMTIPGDADRVGWYRFGAGPGEGSGSVVLAGHVDTRRAGPGAFYPLSGAQPGDEVVVGRADGSQLRYRVVGRELLTKTALPVDAIFDRSGPERLTLITCGGPFRSDVRSYRDNLVITAEPVPSGG